MSMSIRPPDAKAFCPLNIVFSSSNIFPISNPASAPEQLVTGATSRAVIVCSREPTRSGDSRREISGYLVWDYAPVPGALILGRAAQPCAPFDWSEVSLLFTTGEASIVAKRNLRLTRSFPAKIWSGTADTAGLAPMRVRTSQPEGCFHQRSIRGQTPLTVRVRAGGNRRSGVFSSQEK